MLIFTVIFAMPLLVVFITSFCKYTVFEQPAFIGLGNYKSLFINNSDFSSAMRNTVLWILLQTTISVAIGVIVALILQRRPFGWKFVRASYMIPNIIPTAATGLMFILLYNPEFGVVKSLYEAFGAGESVPNLFGNSSYTFLTVTSTWIFYSALNTILILSEIGAIPKEIYDSAKVDGANNLQTDIFITLPMLRNILATCVILAAMNMISQFDIIYITTKGGPGSATLNLPIYLFKISNLEMNFGLANSIGVVQIVFGLLLVFVIGKVFRIGQSNE